ncbi:gluconokinase [uncultured Shimia sp.]|uniref:gluconokinase n=1 Tax=uncultured Shimia sp. TaxID=573152 RepID=UPI0025D879F5|nr:gluconokinase [uncultured Shimia sp.]
MTTIDTGKAIIVMGVSGVGKTTVAQALAAEIAGRYVEADEFHPPENIAAMAKGIPLTDVMRRPWLEALSEVMQKARTSQPETPVVVACSALKRAYRDILRAKNPDAIVIYLEADPEVIRARMAAREDHFMPSSLLDSQLATLQRPAPNEACVTEDANLPLSQMVRQLCNALKARDCADGLTSSC